jgi:hypothetical protein
MQWILNVSLSDIKRGVHLDAGINSMLIQICDPDMEYPKPFYTFKEVHQFKFLDIEERDQCIDEEWRCSQEQASKLVQLLKHALANDMNVIVHCHAGVCRSGAVCEVGVMLGFGDTEAFRSPNLLVKHRMMRELGWTYDENEPHTINSVTTEFGIIPPKEIEWDNHNEKVFALARERKSRRKREGDI